MDSFKYSYKTEKDDNILINVYNCGYQKCESGYAMGPVVRNRYLIHHVVSGKGRYTVDQHTYEIHEGDTFIIYPNKVVSYVADESDPWEYYWVGFGGVDVKSLIAKTDFSPEHAVIHTQRGEELKEILLSIYHSSGGEFYRHIAMVGYLYLFLSVLIACSEKKEEEVDILQVYSKKAVDFISENYGTRIAVADIASHLGISRSHLYRVFMKYTGASPQSYLERYRIKQGSILLEQTSLSVSEVANSVGYEDPLYFSKVFKKWMHCSPKEYRKQQAQLNGQKTSL